MRPIELNVDHLVLSRGRREDGVAMLGAAERALARLLEERGVPPGLSPGSHHALARPRLVIDAQASPHATGERLAHALYGQLTGLAAAPGGPTGGDR